MFQTSSTKDQILATMYELIAQEGYDKASIGKLCALVGITKPSVYYYFKSKEEIFLHLVTLVYQLNYEKELACLQDAQTHEAYKTALFDIGKTILSYYQDHPIYRKFCLEVDRQTFQIPALQAKATAFEQEMEAFLRTIVQKGIALAVFPKNALETHVPYLQVLFSGLDDALLLFPHIHALSVWQFSVEQLIPEKKETP